jgi:hypothetical protein
MINLVMTRQLKDRGYFDEDLTLWEIINEVKEEVAKNDIWGFGARFDISCDNGVLNWNGENYDFGFKKLRHGADEIRGIIKDIHDCLDKHNSTHIDLFFPREGIVILLSTGEQIDSVLFYKGYEIVGQDSKGYRQVTYHYKSTDLITPLQIALDFDYVIHEKTVFKWDISMDNGLRQLLKDCAKESKNVNYSLLDVRTEREIAEDNRKQKQEEQEQKQKEQQEQQQEYDKQLQQMLEQFEETKRQMMLLMGRYMSQQQEEEEDEEFEEFEE